MLKELDALFSTLEFEEGGAVLLDSVRWRGRALEVMLDVRTGDDHEPRQAWLVRCADARATRLSPGWKEVVEFFGTHPLLLPYTDRHVQLAFRGRPEEPRAVVGALWEAHLAATDGWFPFDAFFNGNLPLAELIAAGGGILAEGPRSVLEAYSAALREYGVVPSFFAERNPVRWLDGAWIPEPEDLAVLLIGESYAIGAGFDIARVGVDRLEAVT
jgi:hypothetical protein